MTKWTTICGKTFNIPEGQAYYHSCGKCEPKQKRLKMIGNAKVLKNALIE